jgi:hypothetical protein
MEKYFKNQKFTFIENSIKFQRDWHNCVIHSIDFLEEYLQMNDADFSDIFKNIYNKQPKRYKDLHEKYKKKRLDIIESFYSLNCSE